MVTKTCCIFLICIFIVWINCEEYELILETPEDYQTYGFTCSVLNYREENCTLRFVQHPSQLPEYFPPRFRNMSWDSQGEDQGNYIFFMEGSGPFGTRFELRANSESLPKASIAMMKSTRFYTEKYEGFGIWKGYEPQQWWFPLYDPEFNGEWLFSEKGPMDAFGDMIYILGDNNQVNELTVFSSIRILLDPPPKLVHEIRSPEDLPRLGFSFDPTYGEIRNVSNGSFLPDYFPESFKNLTVDEGESIMWLEVDETLPPRRYNFYYYPQFPIEEEGKRPNPSLIRFDFVGKMKSNTRGEMGYGPHINHMGDRNLYTNLSLDYGDDGWGKSRNKAMYLYYFIEYEGVGLFAYNNHVNEFAVFKSIVINYYYWDEHVERTTTTEFQTTTTTEEVVTSTERVPTSTMTTTSTSTVLTPVTDIDDTTTEPATTTTTYTTTTTARPATFSTTGRSSGVVLTSGCILYLIFSVTICVANIW